MKRGFLMNATQKGNYTEQLFILWCIQNSIPVSKPVYDNYPYDFVIDINNKLLKIQIKTSHNISDDVIQCNGYVTVYTSEGWQDKGYENKCDYIVTMYNNIPLFIPISESKTKNNIYVGENPKSNQRSYKKYLYEQQFVVLV